MSFSEDNEKDIKLFCEYLQIDTRQPNVDYGHAVSFLVKQAKILGLTYIVHEICPEKPAVIMTWLGTDQNLPSLLLNSHMDVVPVYPEFWKHPPFSAHRDANGNIYARGSQDMKCVGIQYLAAIRRLQCSGFQPKRTIHVTFVPDEEIGSLKGMRLFVDQAVFKSLTAGFALDEGVASEDDVYQIYNAERNVWWISVTVSGNPGHGSKFIQNTAGEKAHTFIGKMLAFRKEQETKLKALELTGGSIGDVISCNWTKTEGGVEHNVVPAVIKLGFDVRVPPTENLGDLEAMFYRFAAESGDGIDINFEQQGKLTEVTSMDNPFCQALTGELTKMQLKYKVQTFLGATDNRFVRGAGIAALGFSPMINTPQLLHDHNEFLNDKVFIRGVEIYENLLRVLSSV